MFHFENAKWPPTDPRHRFQALTLLGYYDKNDQLTEKDIYNLGHLLEDLDSENYQAGLIHYPRRPALSLEGGIEIDTENPRRTRWSGRKGNIRIRLELHSDIWFPWVHAPYPRRTYEPFCSNHELAELHTPRLNILIESLAETTQALGGAWAIDSEGSSTDYIQMVDPTGIQIDAKPPTGK